MREDEKEDELQLDDESEQENSETEHKTSISKLSENARAQPKIDLVTGKAKLCTYTIIQLVAVVGTVLGVSCYTIRE